MAFPLQPSLSNDLVIQECGSTKFAIYCNTLLSPSQLFREKYQYVNITVAIGALAASFFYTVALSLKTRPKNENKSVPQEIPDIVEEPQLEEKTFYKHWNNESLSALCTDVDQPHHLGTPYPRHALGSLSANSSQADLRRASISSLASLKSLGKSALSLLSPSPSRTSFALPTNVELGTLRPNFRSSIRSFIIHQDENEDVQDSSQQYDLRIVNILSTDKRPVPRSRTNSLSSVPRNSFTSFLRQAQPPKFTMGLVDLRTIDLPNDEESLDDIVESLDILRSQRDCDGIVFRVPTSMDISHLETILRLLYARNVPCFIMTNPDNPILLSLGFVLIGGLIIENAAILPNGRRRGYFGERSLRNAMSKCAQRRKVEPSFFVGFTDLWHTRPSASVVRRAFKLSQFFGATMHHGPRRKHQDEQNWSSKCTNSLSAFDYLKGAEVVRVQKAWMAAEKTVHLELDSQREIGTVNSLDLERLHDVLPGIHTLLRHEDLSENLVALYEKRVQLSEPPLSLENCPKNNDFWTVSPDRETMTVYGHFPITASVSQAQYEAIVRVQCQLHSNSMLQEYLDVDHTKLATQLQQLQPVSRHPHILKELVAGLQKDQIHVFKGLGSGFKVPDSEGQLYAVTRNGPKPGNMDVFISRECADDAGSILHAFYATRGVPRLQRFEEELLLLSVTSTSEEFHLPASIRSDIEKSTVAELLWLLHHSTASGGDHPIEEEIRRMCNFALTEQASVKAWAHLHSKDFLEGTVTMRTVLQYRLDELAAKGASELPSISALVQLYEAVDAQISDALFYNQRSVIDTMFEALLQSFDPWESWSNSTAIDLNTDLFATIFFCVLRRYAFNDVYIETTDRCPFFLTQPDQAGVFSELWVLGSQCEIYFGVQPRTIGDIIYTKYRTSLAAEPPTTDHWNGKDVFTVYSFGTDWKDGDDFDAAGTEFEKSIGKLDEFRAVVTEFGALAIFCVPALLDIVLLTFFGRGFFVTAYMQDSHRLMASYGVLTALLISSGVTGWSASVGGFYLFNHAFHNMAHFLIQRICATFILTIIAGGFGLLAFSLRYSPTAALVFLAYSINISTYLSLLGALATMHDKTLPLTSGRAVIWRTIPILTISPIITTFVKNYDLLVYLLVLYVFLVALLVQFRNLCREWTNWLPNVPRLKEADITEWYRKRVKNGSIKQGDDAASEDDAEAFAKLAALNFRMEVDSAAKHPQKGDEDGLVAKAAIGLPYAKWLLPSSSPADYWTGSWLVELNLEISKKEQIVRGLKEHNIFILFRYGKYDLGANVMLFLVALMDQWVSLLTSFRTPAPTPYVDSRARYAVGFGLSFFLLSAIALDATLQGYWEVSFKSSETKITDLQHAQAIARDWERRKRRLWIQGISKLGFRVLGILGVTNLLLWLFVSSLTDVIMYYAYVIGFAPVLVMQFNRAFTQSVRHHVNSGFIGAAVGLTVGCTLRAIPATAAFSYVFILSLVASSWTAAILTTIWVWIDPSKPGSSSQVKAQDPENFKSHAQMRFGAATYSADFCSVMTAHGKQIPLDDNSILAESIQSNIQTAFQRPNELAERVPWARNLLETASRMLSDGSLSISLVPREIFHAEGHSNCWSISELRFNQLTIRAGFISRKEMEMSWAQMPHELAAMLTESILHHVCFTILNLSYDHAVFAEHFSPQANNGSRRASYQLEQESGWSLEQIVRKCNQDSIRHLCMNKENDVNWESLQRDVRNFLVARVSGRPVPVTKAVFDWLHAQKKDIEVENFSINLCSSLIKKALDLLSHQGDRSSETFVNLQASSSLHLTELPSHLDRSFLIASWQKAQTFTLNVTKWLSVLSGGASEVERELAYTLHGFFGNTFAMILILAYWNFCKWIKDLCISIILVKQQPRLSKFMVLSRSGLSRILFRDSINIELMSKNMTGFACADSARKSKLTLDIYEGNLGKRPDKGMPLATAHYDSSFRLESRQDGQFKSVFEYDSKWRGRWPTKKTVQSSDRELICHYDSRGRVTSGTITICAHRYAFVYAYTENKAYDKDILKAEYRLVGGSDSLTVCWGIFDETNPDRPEIPVPNEKISRVIRTTSKGTFITDYDYKHRRDPILTSHLYVDGRKLQVSDLPEICLDEEEFLKKPKNISFADEDLLIQHSAREIGPMLRWAVKSANGTIKSSTIFNFWPFQGLSSGTAIARYTRVPSWRIRSELWTLWQNSKDVDASTACWLDERILRDEASLAQYWRRRNFGFVHEAKKALNEGLDRVLAAIEMPTDVSQTCTLPIKPSDLFSIGLSKDANQITNRPEDCYRDRHDRISVIFSDMGCWPDAPGGVSNCRRDLVNGHTTIRNHVLAESANEFGISRYQLERNVQSLKILPLWGLDHKTASHGIIDNLLQCELDNKISRTDVQAHITGIFIPLLRRFVKAARMKRPSRSDLLDCSNAVLGIFQYFEKYDYNQTWRSKEVERAWIEVWLQHYDDAENNIVNPDEFFEIERPSMSDMKEAMNLYVASFFIYSVQVPESQDCPRVFQSTHHGISSLLGMYLKYTRNTTFGLWDHAILWRETVLNISAAKCLLPLAVQSMYLAGIGLAARLAYLHVDTIVPCTSVFNPMWEEDIGTDLGRLESRKLFSRKIDPVVNGIGDMSQFQIVDKIKSEKPTVIMLSNIQFIKDIRTAILAADVIVNEYGFKDYRLKVYGAQDREPDYMLEMTQLIAERNLSVQVSLAGFGKPKEVLKEAWVFMNSSLSEGLPLAIAEAALTGIPIVATEVGGTALVLTDPDDQKTRYGEVVPPNDPTSLARAQIQILSLSGPWAKYTTDTGKVPELPQEFTENDVITITKRMHDKMDDRKKLGLKCRDVVERNFSGYRYLREHEQMYWIQWHISKMRSDKKLKAEADKIFRLGKCPPLRCLDFAKDEEMKMGPRGSINNV